MPHNVNSNFITQTAGFYTYGHATVHEKFMSGGDHP